MIDNLLIINKSGGLIYHEKPLRDENYTMVLGSIIQSLNEISRTLMECKSPQFIEYDKKVIAIFRTLSNTTFVLFGDKSNISFLEKIFNEIYKDYANIVMCDPFYNLEMPIKNKNFVPSKYFVN
jgi:hypothetical protein